MSEERSPEKTRQIEWKSRFALFACLSTDRR